MLLPELFAVDFYLLQLLQLMRPKYILVVLTAHCSFGPCWALWALLTGYEAFILFASCRGRVLTKGQLFCSTSYIDRLQCSGCMAQGATVCGLWERNLILVGGYDTARLWYGRCSICPWWVSVPNLPLGLLISLVTSLLFLPVLFQYPSGFYWKSQAMPKFFKEDWFGV